VIVSGAGAICRILGAAECGFLTARGYRAALARPPSARRLRDDLLGGEIARLHVENYGACRVRKMHALLRRQRWVIGRDQVARLMRELGLRGVRRSKRVFTTLYGLISRVRGSCMSILHVLQIAHGVSRSA
jgi:putative transposase